MCSCRDIWIQHVRSKEDGEGRKGWKIDSGWTSTTNLCAYRLYILWDVKKDHQSSVWQASLSWWCYTLLTVCGFLLIKCSCSMCFLVLESRSQDTCFLWQDKKIITLISIFCYIWALLQQLYENHSPKQSAFVRYWTLVNLWLANTHKQKVWTAGGWGFCAHVTWTHLLAVIWCRASGSITHTLSHQWVDVMVGLDDPPYFLSHGCTEEKKLKLAV